MADNVNVSVGMEAATLPTIIPSAFAAAHTVTLVPPDPANLTGNGTNNTGIVEVASDGHFAFILYSVVVPLLFGIITVVGIGGNCLVVYVILSRQKMRTVTNILLLNLAISDLSFLVICPPFTAYQMATQAWPFGEFVCKLMHYLLNVTVYVTIYTLVVISLIRYLTVVHNQSTLQYRTKRNTIIMIIAIWVVMLGLNVPIIGSYGVIDYDGVLACENYSIKIGQQLYATFFAFAYLLPLFVIAVFSVCILHHLQKQKPTMLDKKKSKSSSRKKQASRLLVLVVVIFAIFWLPVHIHLLVAYFGTMPSSKLYQAISVLWNCLAYFNSCVNPIIYNYASKEFRDAFREVMCCLGWKSSRGNGQGDKHHADGVDQTLVTRLSPEENGKQKLLSSPDDNHTDNEQV